MHSHSSSAITPRQEWFNRLIWFILVSTISINSVWGRALGWTIDLDKLAILAMILAPFAAMWAFFKYFYHEPRFALMASVIAQFILLVFASAGFNYVTTTLNLPLLDDELIAIDRMLGFDWLAYVSWVHQYAMLSSLFTFSYNAAWAQLLIGIILLFLTGRFVRLQQFCFIVLVGALVSSALAAIFPAVGGYAYFDFDLLSLDDSVKPAAGLIHMADYTALRNGTFNYVTLAFQGLITFPSYHTSFGIFLVYAFWPLVWLRLPVLLLNIILVFSVPVDGGHWLIDAIGGIAIAFLIIALARKLLPEIQQNTPEVLEESAEDDYITLSTYQDKKAPTK